MLPQPGPRLSTGFFRRLRYTGRVLRRRTLIAGGIVVGVAGASAAAWWLSNRLSTPHLLARMPAENSLILYLDLERIRRAGSLESLLKVGVAPDPDYAAFIRQTGFDYRRDLDAAAVCYLPDRVYVLARGRFDPDRLGQYAVSQGGACPAGRPCRMPASRPGRTISFLMLSRGLLALATAPEPEAVVALQSPPWPTAEALATAGVRINPLGSLLWVTATPASLRLGQLPSNLTLFASALEKAQRAYLFLNDRSPNLEVTLYAICASEDQATELRRLLRGLIDFIGAMLRGGRGGQPPVEWEKVLATAVVEQDQLSVRVRWRIEPGILEKLGS